MSYPDPSPNPYPTSAGATNAAPPTHHLHKSSDVLPGAARSQGAKDDVRDPSSYEDRIAGPDSNLASGPLGGQSEAPASEPGRHDAWTEERPLGVRPTERGGVAVGGRADVPETHASAADKLVGKTQKVVGKMTGNAEMHERGEMREAGGKSAARGEGRAPHD